MKNGLKHFMQLSWISLGDSALAPVTPAQRQKKLSLV